MFIEIKLPDTGVYLYESKHKKGAKVLSHYHDIYQVLYALDGSGMITIEDTKYEFTKDKMVLLSPNTVHSIQTEAKLTVLVLAFSDTRFGKNELEEIMSFFDHRSGIFELDQFTASTIRQLIRKMLFEQTEYDALYRYAILNHLYDILITLGRFQISNKYRDANELRSMQIRKYINSNYFENIAAHHLSDHFGISTRYMNGLFKAKFNETPLQYLQRVRINRARQLLVETDKEILSICFEIGYESVSTFYRTFSNIVGLSPYKYRQINSTRELKSDEAE